MRQHGREWRYLLLRSFRHWDFPKGLVERGETPRQADAREVEEETGLAELVFRWGETFRETEPYSHGKVARYYVAESPAWVNDRLVLDQAGTRWRVTEEALVADTGVSAPLPRVTAFRAFWFGWYAQFPETILVK